MKLKNTFVQGKMNKDLDERLLPKGQYPHAENIRLSNSEASDVGAIENVLGNKSLTTLGLTNAVCIGSFSDDSNQKIYWFITADEKDVVMEYDFTQSPENGLSTVLESPTVLNFSTEHLITGVVKIINGEQDKDLLVWTDDLNQPRCVNIKRFKDNTEELEEEDILLIKKPPMAAPNVSLTTGVYGFDDDLFVSIAYRYVYEDRERSALSSFSNYSFSPKAFELDFKSMDNAGMVNDYNNLSIELNTGSKRVVEIEVVSKEPNSNRLFIIESFDKSLLGWGDEEVKSFTFNNDSVYVALPQDELFRAYDNVPLKAKALELIGTRLVFGNYVEGYNMVDSSGDSLDLEGVSLSLTSSQPDKEQLMAGISTVLNSNDSITLDIRQSYLDISRTIEFYLQFLTTLPSGALTNTRLTKSFNVPNTIQPDSEGEIDITQDPEFYDEFLGTMSREVESLVVTLDPFTVITSNTLFRVTSDNVITAPVLGFTTYTDENLNTVSSTGNLVLTYDPNFSNEVYVQEVSKESLKTNRNYELGFVYLDEFNRASTVQTWLNNTVNNPQENADKSNSIRLDIPNTTNAPYWADRFKVVVRQNRGDYHTIYSAFYFTEDNDMWILLEGDNVNKVKEGDELIPKLVSGEFVEEARRVKVLEVVYKERNFLEGNVVAGETPIELKERAGTYLRIKKSSLPEVTDDTEVYFNDSSNYTSNSTLPKCWVDLHSEEVDGTIEDLTISAGSRITIDLNSRFNWAAGWSDHIFNKEYIVNQPYNTFGDWFTDNVDYMYTTDTNDDTLKDYRPKISVKTGSTIRAEWVALYGDDYTPRVRGVEDNDKLYFEVEGFENGGSGGRNGYVSASVNIIKSGGSLVLETLPVEVDTEIFYETEDTFDITDGLHPEVINLNYHNCYTFWNGVESYRYRDGFNTKSLNIDLRPTSTSIENYKEVRRFADLTYSEPYNENTNLNGINEFNLSKANYKEDVDKKYGYIQHLYSRDTDLLLFQEDKVSKVLYGKNLLTGADGTSNVSAIESVLGQQVTYMGEYGISRNPESFAYNGYAMYFTDSKRGAVMRLTNNGLEEISRNGMRGYFRDSFKENIDGVKLGEFDPYQDQYVLHVKDPKGNYTITYDEKVKGFTSFHSFEPQYMIGMNNNFFTFHEGDLYIHHSEDGYRNLYYSEDAVNDTSESKISLMVNESPSDIKLLKAVSLEGSTSWDIDLSAYVSSTRNPIQSQLSSSDFKLKEGLWFSYVRRSERSLQTNSKASYGIGEIVGLTPSKIVIKGVTDQVSYGDTVFNTNGSTDIGIIQSIYVDEVNNQLELTLDSVSGINLGDFVIGKRDSRIEGESLRGYVMRLDLGLKTTDRVELFAVNTEVIKSFA